MGKTVSEVARSTTANDTLDTTDGAKFEPEVLDSATGSNSGRGSNPVGSTLSGIGGIAKSFGNAVKSALGGGSTPAGGEE